MADQVFIIGRRNLVIIKVNLGEKIFFFNYIVQRRLKIGLLSFIVRRLVL